MNKFKNIISYVSLTIIFTIVTFLVFGSGSNHPAYIVEWSKVYLKDNEPLSKKKFQLDWIDWRSFSAYNRSFFKDKNGIYAVVSKYWEYKKINTDIESFREFQKYPWIMQDDTCIFVRSKCVKKWVNQNIQIFINGNPSNNKVLLESDYTISLKYTWERKEVISMYNIDGAGRYSWSKIDDWLEDEEDIFIFKYREVWTYNLVVFLNLSNGDTIYNMKEIIVYE
jgi:hypothetical protein